MGDERIEQKLLEFLEWENRERAANNTIGALRQEVRSLRIENGELRKEVATLRVNYEHLHHAIFDIARDRLEDRTRIERHGRRITALEHQLALVSQAPIMRDVPDWEANPMDRTGMHNVVALQQAQRELEEKFKAEEDKRKKEEDRKFESGIWWSRQKKVVLLGILATMFSATILGCTGYVAKVVVEKVIVHK